MNPNLLGLGTIKPLALELPLSCWAHSKLLFEPTTFNFQNSSTNRNGISSGIKAWPDNGSGVERCGGLSKRYHMSHAVGVANSIAWQFHPRGTHRVRLFSLDFLWFFLVSRQERTSNPLFAMHFCCDATFQWCSLEKVLRASQYKWDKPWSYKCLAPTGQ